METRAQKGGRKLYLSVRSHAEQDYWKKKIIDFGILFLIVFSPLPAASVNEWSILTIQICTIIMAVAYLLLNKKPQKNQFLTHSLKWPMWMFFAFFMYLLFQIIPLPVWFVKLLSPNTIALKSQFGIAINEVKFVSISVIPAYSFQKALEFISYAILGFLILNYVTTRKQIRRIVHTIIFAGIFQAIYGLYELFNSN